MSDVLEHDEAVCCFCMKPYKIDDGVLCPECGDICCEECAPNGLCPDCLMEEPTS